MSSLIEMVAISKAFGGNLALNDVSIKLNAGTVHALMGENGAGKSTLMKVLAGVVKPDHGEIFKNGKKLKLSIPKDALEHGISTVFQELSLLPNLTIAENMFLGREPTTGFGTIDYASMNKQTVAALNELGLNIDPSTLVSELTIAERQFVEIAHGIKADASVFILDEPTAALNAADVETMNKHIRRLRDEGKAIVYISHRMEEIFNICDSVTVLKDGQHIASKSIAELTPDSLIEMMVGRELEDLFPHRGARVGKEIFQANAYQLTENSQPFSMSLHRGEIVALAGLEGQGQQDFLRSLIGQFTPYNGSISIKGKELQFPVSPAKGIRQLQSLGVGYIPEDRKDEGLFLGQSISHNITMSMHSFHSEFSIAQSYSKQVNEAMASMNVKAVSSATPVNSLSGGNQQKVLLARYLVSDADILLIEEPTRGVDIGAKSEIYKLLREFTDKGGAVLVLSRETLELIGLCDRIYVVHDNTIVSEMLAAEASEHRILDAALSA